MDQKLLPICQILGMSFETIKFSIVLAGMEFIVSFVRGLNSQAKSDVLASLRDIRHLCYPEIDKGKKGDSDFQLLCEGHLFIVRHEKSRKALKQILSEIYQG